MLGGALYTCDFWGSEGNKLRSQKAWYSAPDVIADVEGCVDYEKTDHDKSKETNKNKAIETKKNKTLQPRSPAFCSDLTKSATFEDSIFNLIHSLRLT